MDEASKYAHAAQQVTRAVGMIKDEQDTKQYDEYSTILSGMESFEDAKPPEGVNAKVWNKAMLDRLNQEMSTGQLKEQRFELLKKEMGTKRELMLENARRAESLVATNAGAALDSYMESYSAHPNGINVKRNPESGMFDFEDLITGEKWSENVTLDDARQMTQALLPPGEYEKMYLTDRSRVVNFNKVGMINPDIMENASGDQVSVFTLIDPNTGSKVLKVMGPDGKLDDLDPEELLHGGFKMVNDSREDRMAELGIKKAELQVDRQEQQMHHADESMGLKRRQAEKNLSQGPGVRTGKLSQTEEIMAAYNVDRATAMDILRSDKNLGQRLAMAKTQIKDAMLDPQDERDREKVLEILKQYKVDQLPGHEGFGRADDGQPPTPTQQEYSTGALPGGFVKPGEMGQSAPTRSSDTEGVSGGVGKPSKGGKSKSASGPDTAFFIRALEKQFPDAPDGTIKFAGPRKFIKQQGKWELSKG